MSTIAFISYARVKDFYNAVTNFHTALEKSLQECLNMEVQIFLDKTSIEAGESFNDVLKQQLHEATVLIILLSPVWLSRPMCRAEYLYFKSLENSGDRKRYIIPLLWREVDISDAYDEESKTILNDLSPIEKIDWKRLKFNKDYTNSIDLEVAIEGLADTIKRKIRS